MSVSIPIVPVVSIIVAVVAIPVAVSIGSPTVAADRIVNRIEEGCALDTRKGKEKKCEQQRVSHGRHRGRVLSGNCLNSVGGRRGLVLRKLAALAVNRDWCRLLVPSAYIPASVHPTSDKHGARTPGFTVPTLESD